MNYHKRSTFYRTIDDCRENSFHYRITPETTEQLEKRLVGFRSVKSQWKCGVTKNTGFSFLLFHISLKVRYVMEYFVII